jgi:hypothetical protein
MQTGPHFTCTAQISSFITSLLTPSLLPTILAHINRPYGLDPGTRLTILHGYLTSEDLLEEVQADNKLEMIPAGVLGERPECQRWHELAVLAFVNERLARHRPHFRSNGQPYPWESSRPRTVTPRQLQAVLDQARLAAEAASLTMCGLYLVEKQPGELGELETAAVRKTLLSKKRSSRIDRLLQDFVGEMDLEFERTEDDRTDMLMDLADEIFDYLAK